MALDAANLTTDCLIYIFAFLDDVDLITASSVCKAWHEVAQTAWLWRGMCLQRWGFCNVAQLLADVERHTWKGYYLRRLWLEQKMKSGRTCGDYTCKSLKGHTGRIVGIVYVVGNTGVSDIWNCSPVVCSASTDGTVQAWDIQKGVPLWCSPAQSPMCSIVADPKGSTVFTADCTGVVTAWNALSGQQVATCSPANAQSKLHPLIDSKSGSYLLVATRTGALITLRCPSLSEVSRHEVFSPFRADILHSSPDKKWVLVATKEKFDMNPKVYSSESLCCPVEGDSPVSMMLPVSGCCAAAFFHSQPARLAVIHGGLSRQKTLSVFDLSLKKSKYKEDPQAQLVESFALNLTGQHADIILKTKGNSTVVVADQLHLKVYTLKGTLIADFKDHVEAITFVCVDNFRVVTASRDLSLRVLTWKTDRDKGLTLESQYHLLGGSHSMSRGFTEVACDYSSIVASVESINGKDVLKAYTFDS